MIILVINAGSSSLKFKLFSSTKSKQHEIARGMVDGIGLKSCRLTFKNNKKDLGQNFKIKDHKEAVALALETLIKTGSINSPEHIEAIGHRVVHGGTKYLNPTRINSPLIKQIEKLEQLAPLHNKANLEGIKACQKLFKKTTPQFAIFDTAFHSTMPDKARLYALPYTLFKKHDIQRFGFHGTNHKYVVQEAIDQLKNKKAKIISCHLGNGVSITASNSGKSIDTSMGFTPLEGVMMGTRSGSIDPSLPKFISTKLKIKDTDDLLNHKSGLLGISEISSDMRDIYAKAKQKNSRALFTIEMFSYQIARQIGAYAASLNGLDALIFTAGIGEKAFYVRAQICDYLEFLGLKLDSKKNKSSSLKISAPNSKIPVFVIPADEEKQIAKEICAITL